MSDWQDKFNALEGWTPKLMHMPEKTVSLFWEELYQAFRDRMLSEIQLKWKDHVEASGNEELIARLQQSHE